ncbi:MAG: choice-of-anchor B family protein [Rhodothermia bacterium]|nr:choice-of-anchor B family protein [Rhodothermia bacterium]
MLLNSNTSTRIAALACMLAVAPGSAAAQNVESAGSHAESCVGGQAGGFACSSVDLLSFVPRSAIGGAAARVNDLWGWTDPQSGREYGLIGLSNGTAFVDVTIPEQPEYIGILPTQSYESAWRDIKVYANHAFIVAEASSHGVQVFDLTRLRAVTARPATFAPDAVYTGIGSAHNIAVNEETGFAYSVGSRGGDFLCGPGLHMIDVRLPTQPALAGCFAHSGTGRAGTGYTHDAHCVIYRGPDGDHSGKEICVGANENYISIADVTDKRSPRIVASGTYPTSNYIHQGWFTDDHRYFLQNDELDESRSVVMRTTTYIWDLTDLDAPVVHGTYEGPTTASDHNLYVVNHWAYMANYRAGLQVVDFTDINRPREVAFFDTYPASDLPGTTGAWSVYPFFDSGNVLVSSIEDGFFILRPPFNKSIGVDNEQPTGGLSVDVFPNPATDVGFVRIETDSASDIDVLVFDVLGREVNRIRAGTLSGGASRTVRLDAAKLAAGRYVLQVRGRDGFVNRLITVAG